MDIRIIRYDQAHIGLLPHADQPFKLIGRLIPTYDGRAWHTSEELFDASREKTYPGESYDVARYLDNDGEAAFLAMDGDARVGSVRVCRRWNGSAFIDDLKVDASYRGRGVGFKLLDAARAWGREVGLRGVSLETQDDNLLACRFYLKYGFRLGGIDTRAYTDEAYRGETALYFYLDD